MRNRIRLGYKDRTIRQIRLSFMIVFIISFIFILDTHAAPDFIEINISSASQVKPGGTLSIWVTVSNFNIENKSIYFDSVEFESPFNQKISKINKKETMHVDRTLISIGRTKSENEGLKQESFSKIKKSNAMTKGEKFNLSDMKVYADKEKQLKEKITQGVETERIDIVVPEDIQEGQAFSIPVRVLLSETGRGNTQSASTTQLITTQSVEQQITFTATSNPVPKRAVLIIVDGARADKLYQIAANNPNGNLSWMINNGVKFSNTVNVFPSITVVNHPSILTGTYPSKHGITSATVFDKTTNEGTNYYSIIDNFLASTLNNDLQVPTIYEDMPSTMISRVFTELVDRGADNSELSLIAALNWQSCESLKISTLCETGDSDVINNVISLDSHDNRNFDLTVIWLAGNDFQSHAQGPDSTTEVLNNVDVQIGRLKEFYGPAIVDETIFIVTADHGQTGVNSTRKINSDQLANVLEANGYYKNASGLNSEHDYYVGGNGGGSEEIYIQSDLVLNDGSSYDGTWNAQPRWQDIQPAAHAFYSQVYFDTMLVRYQNSSGYRVYKENADGTPYTLSLADYFNGKDEYVDAFNRINKLDSKRSGDLILLANYSGGYYFDSKAFSGDHGNLNPGDSYVPLVISGPSIRHDVLASAHTVDIAPTIANLLGFSMSNVEGIILPIKQDTIAPTITGNTPTGGNVSVNTQITTTFSEAMNKASVEAAFSISPVINGTSSWSGNTLIYALNSNLTNNKQYTVTVGTGAKDLAGNNLQSSYSWQFTTALPPAPTTRTVCSSGCDHTIIQAAIDAANPGDTIEVRSGTYPERVNVYKQLALQGIGMPVVDANGSGSAITLSADGIILEGFTVIGSGDFPEAGIKVTSNNSTLSGNNNIYNNFFNNINNINIDNTSYSNTWNTTRTSGINIIGGPYIAGNVWAYPNGTGFSQTCEDAENDGICDSPYTFNSNNIDYLPLAPLNLTQTVITSPLAGDLNGNGVPADAGDLVLMKRASIGEIQADSRYDLNNNGQLADAGDLVLMKRASIGEINLSLL